MYKEDKAYIGEMFRLDSFDFILRFETDFREIEDEEFHKLRKDYIYCADNFLTYIGFDDGCSIVQDKRSLDNVNDNIKGDDAYLIVQDILNLGFEYCMMTMKYDDIIKDEYFHKLRGAYLNSAKKLFEYLDLDVMNFIPKCSA